MENNFSMNHGWGVVSGRFKCIIFIVCFNSIIIISAPPQVIRHWILEAEDPSSTGPVILRFSEFTSTFHILVKVVLNCFSHAQLFMTL